MIDLMTKTITDMSNLDEGLARFISGQILKSQEYSGMLPPKPLTGYYKGHWVEATLKNEWEKEDE